MKLIALLMVTAVLHVSAGSYAQKISLSEKNAPLVKVFDDISNQTGFDFLFTAKTLQGAKQVSIDVKNADLSVVLNEIFRDQPFSYSIKNKTIVVSENRLPKLLTVENFGDLKGTVVDSLGRPLFGVNVRLGSVPSSMSTTNEMGYYSINQIPAGTYKVTISYVGYQTVVRTVNIANEIGANTTVELNIMLRAIASDLNEIVVSTGYQTLPKERATGSFETLDNKLFNRTVSPNLLDHLDGLVSGVHFDNRQESSNFGSSYTRYPQGTPQFSIRGLSTITTYINNTATTSQQPLIVLDNFPYSGDINSINPNDVESLTILKDAAAASIWGARAGNGVLVITTKKGKYNQKPVVDFNTSLTIGSRPDLFSQRQMSTNDYIGLEKDLYTQGKYDAYYNPDPANNYNGGKAVSDVIDILFAVKSGTITQAQADAQIAALAKNDIRNDLKKYFFRNAINQQYNVNVRGGSTYSRYYLSAGYENDQAVDFSSQKRFTLSGGNTFRVFKNLEITIPLYFTQNKTINNAAYNSDIASISPYSRLVDNAGNPVSVKIANGYSTDFISKVNAAGLYDLSYYPLTELHANQFENTTLTQFRISPDIRYTLPLGFSAEFQYQYSRAMTNTTNLQDESTFAIRNLVDQYAQIAADGSITYPISKGGILKTANSAQVENFLRASLSYNHEITPNHRIDFIGGFESNQTAIDGSYNSMYGYNTKSGTFQTNVDYNTYYNNTIYSLSGLPFSYTQQIPSLQQGITGYFTAYRSYFGNAAYTFKSRYILSGSARVDQANLYGVNTNLRKKALWSIGGSWIINHEDFYRVKWLPSLKLRATYGFQGNPPSSVVTSLATVNYYSPTSLSSGLPYATLTGLPNPNLTWEKVSQLNLGLDFGLKNNILSGSVEYYKKNSNNLIASYAIDPTTGASTRTGNVANLTGYGIDINLVSQNIDTKNFKWSTRFLFGYNTDKVTKYLAVPTTYSAIYNAPSPIVGNAVYGVYSYKWGGLDASGNPQGYDTAGKLSADYNSIVNNTPLKDLVYNGRATPSIFGSFINSFTYRNFTVSANITYEAGFYFRARSVNYSNLYGNNMLGSVLDGVDYNKRWQKAGDENHTYVPSAPTLANIDYYRDQFYQYSSVLVLKGDNIRLKDISANYSFDNLSWFRNTPFSAFQIYSYYKPNTLLWKANKLGIDPDFQVIKPAKTITFGIRAILK
ncbi:TonB-linked outer membrane protein, SusC/RagA family [Chitinophaga sp. YR573]|uniref:SusC/RagA family TonB-linked outer membrane protein n=1 Tax=Chitinophaga sp. YR573 TaxID=1881040 RepID=UPI0008D0CE88|nr:SusC/RagA family TonB-linked outer membrane protein [Chitinophaga sp. YR573]SEW43336.1 TonB-linked outer membrane protein, SusC/RagA family [Chitinophaga sp. YR573]